jgi:multiple sugar transport system permease protein
MSLRPDFSFIYFPISLIPEKVSLENYATLFQRSSTFRWILNSFIVATSVVIIHILTSSMAGYAFARGDFPGREIIFWMLMASLMVPATVTTVPLFIIVSRLKWADTFYALILPASCSIFSTFLMRQHVMTIPRDYDDAALIDGASRFDIYWRVLLPLTKPTLATIGTLSFLNEWNAFLWPLVATSSERMRTLTVGLATMVMRIGGAGFQLAGATVAFLPTFIFFLLMQRYVVQGVAITGVTGT